MVPQKLRGFMHSIVTDDGEAPNSGRFYGLRWEALSGRSHVLIYHVTSIPEAGASNRRAAEPGGIMLDWRENIPRGAVLRSDDGFYT